VVQTISTTSVGTPERLQPVLNKLTPLWKTIDANEAAETDLPPADVHATPTPRSKRTFTAPRSSPQETLPLPPNRKAGHLPRLVARDLKLPQPASPRAGKAALRSQQHDDLIDPYPKRDR
jgi:hypothetical protein